MFGCYFDEAGGRDYGYTVVAGYVASLDQWEHFEVDWKLLLINYKVPYFHMSKIAQCKPPFDKWKDTPHFRARFLRDAADIIQQRVRRGFSCFVRHECFERADSEYELRETFGSPYALAGMLCVSNAIRWRRQTTMQPLDLEYVFEDGGPDKRGLVRGMEEAKMSIPIFQPSRDIRDKKSGDLRTGVVQLQAADYLAYEIRKYVKDYIESESQKRLARGSLQALMGVEVDRFFLAYEGIVNVCKVSRLKRRKPGE